MSDIIRDLTSAVTSFGLYPANHPKAGEPLATLSDTLRRSFADSGAAEYTLLLVDDELVVDGVPQRGANLLRDILCDALARREVERITLSAGIEADELAALVAGLGGNGPLSGSRHVVLGHVTIADAGQSTAAAISPPDGIDEAHIDALQTGLEALEGDALRGFDQLDRAIWQLMEATAQSSRAFLLAATLRRASDRLYRHSVAVCLHAMALARALGIAGTTLHDVAVGALLHDIGLLELSPDLTRVHGPLDATRRAALARHPELGAARLARIGTIGAIPILVAYEHHVRWDGTGGYPRTRRRPNLATQITAVADVWDMAVHPPSRVPRAQRRRRGRQLLTHHAGTLLNPRLVTAFLHLVDPADEAA